MDSFKLQSDEVILLRQNNVMREGVMTSYTDELILTNKDIICVCKGLLGGTKDVFRYPLRDLKVYEGQAQVKVGKMRTGAHRLEFYFKDHQKYFAFQTATKIDYMKWIRQINKLVGSEEGNMTSSGQHAIEGVTAVAETVKDTLDSVISVFGKKSKEQVAKMKRTCTCPNCGAEVVGIKGRLGKCEYCGKHVTLK